MSGKDTGLETGACYLCFYLKTVEVAVDSCMVLGGRGGLAHRKPEMKNPTLKKKIKKK